MQFRQSATRFLSSEDGATSVDWIVISAILFGIVFVVAQSVWGSIGDYSLLVSNTITARPIGTY